MAEETPATGGTPDADATSASNTTTNTTTTDIEQQDAPLKPEGQKALQAFKERAKGAEQRERELQARLKELEDKDKSELEKAQSRIGELEQSGAGKDRIVQELRVQIAVMKSAAQVGISDPDAAAKLIDWDAIEYDDDQPKNVGKLLDQLVKDKPYLKSGAGKPQGTADGGQGAGGETASFNDQLRAGARRH